MLKMLKTNNLYNKTNSYLILVGGGLIKVYHVLALILFLKPKSFYSQKKNLVRPLALKCNPSF